VSPALSRGLPLALSLCVTLAFALALSLFAGRAAAGDNTVPLRDPLGALEERVVEAMLSPAEFPALRISHVSENDEALFCLDSSLGAQKPFVQVYPERIPMPDMGGVRIRVVKTERRLTPVAEGVTDRTLDAGFAIRWLFRPLGLRFDDGPSFVVAAVGAEVFSTKTGQTLMFWEDAKADPICDPSRPAGAPRCDLPGISREVRDIALSPDGGWVALAISGIKPRLELYRIDDAPHLHWQTAFPTESGGVLHVAFSDDGHFVTALLGDGATHRFDLQGGRHLRIPSLGRTALAAPQGNRVLIGGRNGTVTLWRLQDGTIDWQLPARTIRSPAAKLAISANGQRIAMVDFANARTLIRVWDFAAQRITAQLSLPDDRVNDVAFDERGDHLYIAHERDGLLRFRVASGAQPEATSAQGLHCRNTIAWVPHRQRIWCSVPGGIIEIDERGERTHMLETSTASARSHFAVSATAERTVSAADGHLLIW